MVWVVSASECGGDDGLALCADGCHVVEVVGLHCETREEACDPSVFFWCSDSDCAVAFAAGAFELVGSHGEAGEEFGEERTDGVVACSVDVE